MPPEIIERSFDLDDFDIKRDRAGRTVTAYAAVFGQDTEIRDKHGHYIEGINRSAFNRTLSHGIQRIKVHYNHGYDLTGRPNGLLAVPIATPVEIRPDGRGLLTISRYNDGELADAVLAAWEGGQITGQSFAGRVYQSRELGRRGKLPVIERTELGLREYGPTHAPAYEGAGLVTIRNQDELIELVRSIIREQNGTSSTSPIADDATPPGPGVAQDSPDGHSERSKRQRILAIRRGALDLGVKRDAQEA